MQYNLQTFKYSLIFVSVFFCVQSLQASRVQELSHQEGVKKIMEYGQILEKRKFVSFNFHQKVYRKTRNKTVSSQGRALFAKPNKFRWTFHQSNMGEWIFDGKTLFHHQADKKQARSYSLISTQMAEFKRLVDMVLNTKSLLSEFELKKVYKNEHYFEFVLKPRKQKNIDSLSMKFNDKTKYLNEIVMFLSGGNKTTFSFSKPDFKTFPENKFQLDRHVKVIQAL